MKERTFRARATAGASLLELIAALGIATVVAGLSGGALARLARATTVASARVRVMSVLLEARRLAYAAEATTEVSARPDDAVMTLRAPDGGTVAVPLPSGTVITQAPATGRVRFYTSGLADNATFAVGSADHGAAQEQVVVNQRGLVEMNESGSSLLEAVVALGTAALLLGGAAEQGLRSATALARARELARALTLGRNVLDRALAAPCAPGGYAAGACVEPFRCTVAAQPIGQRVGEHGKVWMVRLTVEVLVHEEGQQDRALARLVSIGTQPVSCA